MGPFALPVPSWRLGHQMRKRKRDAETQDEGSPSPEAEPIPTSSHLPTDVINPRSHSPNTLRQFTLAGLSPEEEVPSKIHPNFPHKSLPPKWQAGGVRSKRSRSRTSAVTSGSEADIDTDGESQRQRDEEMLASSSDRIKHLNTMMAILHKSIHENDMPRAKRAFSLLTRTRDVDIRLNEMWTLGTEILMRDGETKKHNRESEAERAQHEAATQVGDETAGPEASNLRWGSANNMEKVRTYLETLAQHHPYNHHFPRSISAIDFWPALYSIEIYNVDAECRNALQRLDETASLVEHDFESEAPASQTGSEDYDTQMERREYDRARTQLAARDEIRRETQVAAQQIAERMENLMLAAPYTLHVELLRLRGMLALYIGDLYLPSQLLNRGDITNNSIGDRLQRLSLAEHVRKAVQNPEERDAVRRREEEIEKARGFFTKLVERGGELEPWLLKFLDSDEDDASTLS